LFTKILNHQNTQIQTRGLPFQQYHRLNSEQYEHNDEPSNKITKIKKSKKDKDINTNNNKPKPELV
jgi:hypothetical protein